MSTRQQRQEWQDFREAHGKNVRQFTSKWRAMFGREPSDTELTEYKTARTKLLAPLGARAKALKDDFVEAGGIPGQSPYDLGVIPMRDFNPGAEDYKMPVQLVTLTTRYEWDMGHRLPSHNGKCRRLHGHRYTAEIDVTGPLMTLGPSMGMVVDFYVLKKAIDAAIGHWDHRTMLHEEDPLRLDDEDDTGVLRVSFVPTAENIAREVMRVMRMQGLNITRVRVYETPNGWAEVRA